MKRHLKMTAAMVIAMVTGSVVTLAVVNLSPAPKAIQQPLVLIEPQQNNENETLPILRALDPNRAAKTSFERKCDIEQAKKEQPATLVAQLSYFQQQTEDAPHTGIIDENEAVQYLKDFYYNQNNSFHDRLDAFSTVLAAPQQPIESHDIEHLLNELSQSVEYIDNDDTAAGLQMLTDHLNVYHIPQLAHHLDSNDADVRIMALSAIASADQDDNYQATITKHYQTDPDKAVRNHTFSILSRFYSLPKPN